MRKYTFVREGGWYIDLPEYLEAGGAKGDLAMVAGADTMLDRISGGTGRVTLLIDEQPFPGADTIDLQEVCEPAMGGGYYYMDTFEGERVGQRMWLCDVTNFVFGHLPPRIYVQRTEED